MNGARNQICLYSSTPYSYGQGVNTNKTLGSTERLLEATSIYSPVSSVLYLVVDKI